MTYMFIVYKYQVLVVRVLQCTWYIVHCTSSTTLSTQHSPWHAIAPVGFEFLLVGSCVRRMKYSRICIHYTYALYIYCRSQHVHHLDRLMHAFRLSVRRFVACCLLYPWMRWCICIGLYKMQMQLRCWLHYLFLVLVLDSNNSLVRVWTNRCTSTTTLEHKTPPAPDFSPLSERHRRHFS